MKARCATTRAASEGVAVSEKYVKDPEAIARLTPHQYSVTQESATEPAFRNEFWDTRRRGSTSTSCPASRCSPRPRSSTAGADGRASRAPRAAERGRAQGPHHGMTGPRSARQTATATWATSSTTDPRTKAACATASTPRRYDSSRTTTSRLQGYGEYKVSSTTRHRKRRRHDDDQRLRRRSSPEGASGACRTSSGSVPGVVRRGSATPGVTW
jgi:hypothetical protein